MRGETALEGYQAITEEQVAESRERARPGSLASKKPGRTTAPEREPAGVKLRKTAVYPALAPDDDAPLADPVEDSTLIEGLKQVTLADEMPDPVGLEETTGPDPVVAPTPSPAELSGLYEAPNMRQWPRPAVMVSLWLVATAMGVLVVYFIMVNRTDSLKNSASVAEASRPITVPAGPFRRGLNEEVRSFILQSCAKIEDDLDDCEQDKLLKGEFPEKTVELPAYRIDSKEVTGARYGECISAGSCKAPDYRECAVWTHQGLQVSLRVPKILREPQRPVTCVTRAQAQQFCQWAGGDLPTHDQWEKAARGADGNIFPWGDAWDSAMANWGESDIARTSVVGKLDGFEWTAPPGSFPDATSPHGLYDMAGNVAEWVRGDDALIGHARGGSWISNPFDLRTTGRLEIKADQRRTDVGFRCTY